MEVIVTISEIILFFVLVYVYYNVSSHTDTGTFSRVVEVISLYGVSFWALLGNLKFIIWAALIAVIGLIKFLTTKRHKIERGI